MYINSFVCSVESCGSNGALNLVDTAILKINMWCRRQLESYHFYFSQVGDLPRLDNVSAEDFFDPSGHRLMAICVFMFYLSAQLVSVSYS